MYLGLRIAELKTQLQLNELARGEGGGREASGPEQEDPEKGEEGR